MHPLHNATTFVTLGGSDAELCMLSFSTCQLLKLVKQCVLM